MLLAYDSTLNISLIAMLEVMGRNVSEILEIGGLREEIWVSFDQLLTCFNFISKEFYSGIHKFAFVKFFSKKNYEI